MKCPTLCAGLVGGRASCVRLSLCCKLGSGTRFEPTLLVLQGISGPTVTTLLGAGEELAGNR